VKRDLKPDTYIYGHIYQLTDLPEQSVSEFTDGVSRSRRGVEQCGHHLAVVVSTQEFNDEQNRGLVIVPMTSATVKDAEKFSKPQPTWVRVMHSGRPAYVICEQIRYVDRGRCGKHLGPLQSYDLAHVEGKLRKLLFTK
jgi:mRNA-degrading endonuclease toxin of MazEF toxin-antitoxin module